MTEQAIDHLAGAYGRSLLRSLGIDCAVAAPARHPAIAWAESGAMALTGAADGAPELCPAPLASCADGALAALGAVAGAVLPITGAALLGERAAVAGLRRAGAISPGGGCRLLASADGWLAVNLARPSDWELLPAWLEHVVAPDWPSLEAAVAERPAAALVEQGRLLGLAVAPLAPPAEHPVPWCRIVADGPARCAAPPAAPLVLDLTALWAGPLAGHLLQALGGRVVKVESLGRPDGARQGPAGFYDLLNAGKPSVALDFTAPSDIARLLALIGAADIVLESARPRALHQLGIEAEALVRSRPGLTWISLTGYGRQAPEADWIAYGDDAGVAAGLSALLPRPGGRPIFCADAIADPLTGLHAALAAWCCYRQGRSRLVAMALRDVVAHCIQAGSGDPAGWAGILARSGVAAAAPRARAPAGPARPLGADTAATLAELAPRC